MSQGPCTLLDNASHACRNTHADCIVVEGVCGIAFDIDERQPHRRSWVDREGVGGRKDNAHFPVPALERGMTILTFSVFDHSVVLRTWPAVKRQEALKRVRCDREVEDDELSGHGFCRIYSCLHRLAPRNAIMHRTMSNLTPAVRQSRLRAKLAPSISYEHYTPPSLACRNLASVAAAFSSPTINHTKIRCKGDSSFRNCSIPLQ
ncbi:hypothetical protein FQZ97_676800 [compost metagenome]